MNYNLYKKAFDWYDKLSKDEHYKYFNSYRYDMSPVVISRYELIKCYEKYLIMIDSIKVENWFWGLSKIEVKRISSTYFRNYLHEISYHEFILQEYKRLLIVEKLKLI